MSDAGWEAATRAFLGGLGGAERPLHSGKHPLEFVQHHDLRIDRAPFDFDAQGGYPHLIDLYSDPHPYVTCMMGAQAGKTALAMARQGWLMAGGPDGTTWGSMFGWYFPTNDLTRDFSQARFGPFVRGSIKLRPWVGRDTVEGRGQDAVRSRTLGPSRLFFLSADGKASTESFPFRGVTLDEVRRMPYSNVQLIEERLSAQKDPYMTRVSTAFYPNSDIHLYFLRGNQSYFHSACGCPDGCVLATWGPECVLDLRKASPQLVNKARHAFAAAGLPYLGIRVQDEERWSEWAAAYWCPQCGEIVVNPRDGWWEPHNPTAWEHSYQLSQVLTPTFPAARMLQKFARTDEPVDMQEVWRSGFGMPYVDLSKQPVTEEHLRASIRTDIVWPAHLPRKARLEAYPTIAMGVDVQAGYLVATMLARMESGKTRIVHCRIVDGSQDGRDGTDPWRELARMMVEWQVRACVVDAQPEANAARQFCQAFRGRAWMAYYRETDSDTAMIAWGDVAKEARQRGEERLRHTVSINRSPAMDWSLSHWRAHLMETPPPMGLVQSLPVDGQGKPMLAAWLTSGERGLVPVLRDIWHVHYQRVAFEDQRDEMSGKAAERATRLGAGPKRRAVHVGLDPHAAHSTLYAMAALSRVAQRDKATG